VDSIQFAQNNLKTNRASQGVVYGNYVRPSGLKQMAQDTLLNANDMLLLGKLVGIGGTRGGISGQ